MANSRYGYVKAYEAESVLLPGCWIVVRLDGKGFTKFAAAHKFEKPNDARALALMDRAAQEVLQAYRDIRLAFGQSDEYSFTFYKHTTLYGRRQAKLVSLVVSCFTASYVRFWPEYMPTTTLTESPSFDGRAVCYPTDEVLRDYLSWRQVDTHINTQYNTCFWSLVHGGKTAQEAQNVLKGTLANFKNELLFRDFGINYSQLPERFRKGSVVFWLRCMPDDSVSPHAAVQKPRLVVQHVDIIKDAFWQQHIYILQ